MKFFKITMPHSYSQVGQLVKEVECR